ncbi:MAG: CPBP family intramembrane metalloprotease [Candidatus Omnitrophica bacterium]|nr:CPBP family intramembrane metalloprotease [Candidatus Omnitrophota bacterium]MBU1996132.1 CPBP family intramembrane metalloprotease [Candidatus Omnitrophota bacterium]MBU4334876.1 CPBP family intramembrane metalloprotease [Candidatus Omnitrophota bacterium]
MNRQGKIDKKISNMLEYVYVAVIIFVNMSIIKFLQGVDSGPFSWPRIIIPNVWVFTTSLIWFKLRPVPNFKLDYTYDPMILRAVALSFGFVLIFQRIFIDMTLPEAAGIPIIKFMFLAAFIPFCEEFFFRGLFFHALMRDCKGWVMPAIVVTFVFSYFHLPQGVDVFFIMLFFSAFLCFVTYITKSITCGVMVHICWNALYYNKLIIDVGQKWIFTIFVIAFIGFIAWKPNFYLIKKKL